MTDTFLVIELVQIIVGLYLMDFGLIRRLVAVGVLIFNIPLILSTTELTTALINAFITTNILLSAVALALVFVNLGRLLTAWQLRMNSDEDMIRYLELLV